MNITKDVTLHLKYSDLINAVTACPLSFVLLTLPTKSKAIHLSFHVVRVSQIDYIGFLPTSEVCKYALVCADTVYGITQAFPFCHANQAATIRLEKLNTMYGWIPSTNRK